MIRFAAPRGSVESEIVDEPTYTFESADGQRYRFNYNTGESLA